MGLPDRRALKDFQEKRYPDLVKKIETAAGFKVPVEVNWDTIAQDGKAKLYDEAFEKVYFTPVIQGLQKVAVDDLARQAIRKGLKKVVLENTGDLYGPKAVSFKDGVLKIDHQPFSNIPYVAEREKAVVGALEGGL